MQRVLFAAIIVIGISFSIDMLSYANSDDGRSVAEGVLKYNIDQITEIDIYGFGEGDYVTFSSSVPGMSAQLAPDRRMRGPHIDIAYKIWSLMDEPVWDFRPLYMLLGPVDGAMHIHRDGREVLRLHSARQADKIRVRELPGRIMQVIIPYDLWQKARVTNFSFSARLSDDIRIPSLNYQPQIYLRNPSVTASEAEQWGWGVPGSRNWSRLFVNPRLVPAGVHPYDVSDERYLSEEESRAVIKKVTSDITLPENGPFTAVDIWDIQLDLWPIYRALREDHPEALRYLRGHSGAEAADRDTEDMNGFDAELDRRASEEGMVSYFEHSLKSVADSMAAAFESADEDPSRVAALQDNVDLGRLAFDMPAIESRYDHLTPLWNEVEATLGKNFVGRQSNIIDAGAHLSCTVRSSSRINCWGRNRRGIIEIEVPDDIIGISGNRLGVLILSESGSVYSWIEYYNRLDAINALRHEIEDISSGHSHYCVVTYNGGAKCWGGNVSGQLGNGTFVSSSDPVDVIGLSSGIAEISAGHDFTCALTVSGGVKCWGNNDHGQLGGGSLHTPPSSSPVDVKGLTSGVTAISAGAQHVCALTASGVVKCWGRRLRGFDHRWSSFPSPVVEGRGISAISAGGYHTCAINNSGGVQCWGSNSAGQLGRSGAPTTPVDVRGLSSGVTAISAGESHTCASLDTGSIKCWGDNRAGQLGDGTTTNRSTPVDISLE